MTVILGSDAAGETLKNIIKEYLLANDYDNIFQSFTGGI